MVSEYLNTFLCHMNVLARKVATKNNLSLSQYYTLSNISSDGVSMSDLSLVLGVDNSTLTRNNNILINRSLVRKEQSLEDKREQLVLLSSKGLGVVQKLDTDMENLLNQFTGGVNEEQRQQFIDIIEQINWKMSCYINEL